jgi:hypothetical protein
MNKHAAFDATMILVIVLVGVAVVLGGIFGIGWLLYQQWGDAGVMAMIGLLLLAGLWTAIYHDIRDKPRGGGGTGVY